MKTTRAQNLIAVTLVGALALATTAARAGSESHYAPGVFNIRDYFVPDPGLYGGVYNYYYTAGQYNDRNGNKLSSITINPGPGPGLTLKVNPSVDVYALAPLLIWISPWNFDGVKFGAYISPSFANASVQASVETLRGRGINPSTSQFDVGDLFVQPIWLGYSLTNWDFSAAYGFYAPVGRYNTVTYTLPVVGTFTTTDPNNIGLGFWTQQFQGAAAWYPWADKRMAVVGAVTYENNSRQQGISVTPGQHLTLNWGISQYLPITKDQKLLAEIGPAGYDDWQITNDYGSGASNTTVHNQVHAAGGEFGLAYVPWNAALTFHAYHQFSVVDGLQGNEFDLSFVIKF